MDGPQPQSDRPQTRCPAVLVPEVTPCDPTELAPLVDWLHAGAVVDDDAPRPFPRGTVLDGGTRLDLCKQSIGPAGARALLHALPDAPDVRAILLGTDAIGDAGAADVGAFVADHPDQLRTVYLGCNRITATGAEALASGLRGSAVEALWLKRNPIGDDGGRALVQLLEPPHEIAVLDLFNTQLGDAGLQLLCEALAHPEQTLHHLYLGGNGIGIEGARDLAACLATNHHLRGLYLSVNQLGDDGAGELLRGLRDNHGLRVLTLGSNGITAAGGRALAAVVGEHPGLEEVSLSRAPSTLALGATDNAVGNECAPALAAMIESSPSLRVLDLAHNGITSRGALQVLAAVENSSRLVRLRLGRGVARSIKRRLRAALARNTAPAIGIPEHLLAIQSVYRAPRPGD